VPKRIKKAFLHSAGGCGRWHVIFLVPRSRKIGFNRRRCGVDHGAERVNSANPVEESRRYVATGPVERTVRRHLQYGLRNDGFEG